MPVFDNADADYVRWLEAHPAGYILNTYRKPHPNYLVLHRAACKSISRVSKPPVRWTTGAFIKVCESNIAHVETWCRNHTASPPQPCGMCHPHAETR